jgi:hypothetical protein
LGWGKNFTTHLDWLYCRFVKSGHQPTKRTIQQHLPASSRHSCELFRLQTLRER